MFRAAYGVSILHDGLGIDWENDKLLFTDKIESPSGQHTILDWTLGNLSQIWIKFHLLTLHRNLKLEEIQIFWSLMTDTMKNSFCLVKEM